MTHRDLVLYWSTLGFEGILCLLIYVRRVYRRLPFFATYACVVMMGTLCIRLVYNYFGFRSAATYYIAWISVGLNAIALSFAVGELCRYGFQAYRGIWVLACRILILLLAIFMGHATLDAWGQPDWIATSVLTMERDIGIAAAVILVTLLLIRNHYGLTLDPLQGWIATGMLVLLSVNIVSDSMLRSVFTSYMVSWADMSSQVDRVNEWWNTLRLSSFIVSMSVWCFALRKPLPAPAKEPVLLSPEVYRELSPAVNLRLRAFNDRLQEMLKP